MSTDPLLNADSADVAEQDQDAVPPGDDDSTPEREPGTLPDEANEADVAEQQAEVPGWRDADGEES